MTKSELEHVIGANIKSRRKMRGLTQEQVAESVGISTPFYAQIESGKRFMSLYVLYRLADTLGVSIETLIYGQDRKVNESAFTALLEGLTDEQVAFVVEYLQLMREKVWKA